MRAPMDDHQFALAAREHLGAADNAAAYDDLLATCEVARDRSAEEVATTRAELEQVQGELSEVRKTLTLVRGAEETARATDGELSTQ